MSSILPYIFKATICISVFYLLFKILLRKDNDFAIKRALLLSFIVASLIIPLILISQLTQNIDLTKLVPVISSKNIQIKNEPVIEIEEDFLMISHLEKPTKKIKNYEISTINLLLYIYLSGIVISFLLLFRNIFIVLLIFQKAKIKKMKGYRLLIVDREVPSFAFLNSIVISKNDYNIHGSYILTHEIAHINLYHFYDLILLEIVKIILWFNPVVYWIIKDLNQIHEFQADKYTIHSGIDTTQYQLLIIKKSVGQKRFALANSFNQCQIKKRITMINNPKKLKTSMWKLITFIPLAAILIYAFSACSSMPTETQNQSAKIQGTWKLVSYNYSGDSLNSYPLERIKYITNNTFSWVTISPDNSLVISSADGTYNFLDDNYIENIKHGSSGMLTYIGAEQKYTVTIENNTLQLKGFLSTGQEIEEIWEKLYTN